VEAPRPYNEENRLRALHRYQILDTPPEPRFDAIVAQAALTFDVPVALFTLVDESRQWFKSRVGLDVVETERAVSFCAHAIASDTPLVLEDTLKFRRFADNPLVVGFPHIRFYAGAPVHAAGGEPLGTICVIDSKPRSCAWEEFLLLRNMATQIEEQLELRHSSAQH